MRATRVLSCRGACNIRAPLPRAGMLSAEQTYLAFSSSGELGLIVRHSTYRFAARDLCFLAGAEVSVVARSRTLGFGPRADVGSSHKAAVQNPSAEQRLSAHLDLDGRLGHPF